MFLLASMMIVIIIFVILYNLVLKLVYCFDIYRLISLIETICVIELSFFYYLAAASLDLSDALQANYHVIIIIIWFLFLFLRYWLFNGTAWVESWCRAIKLLPFPMIFRGSSGKWVCVSLLLSFGFGSIKVYPKTRSFCIR